MRVTVDPMLAFLEALRGAEGTEVRYGALRETIQGPCCPRAISREGVLEALEYAKTLAEDVYATDSAKLISVALAYLRAN